MSKFPVFLIDNHINLKLLYILLILSELNISSKRSLTVRKIQILNFLLKRPSLLIKILKELGEKIPELNLDEINAVDFDYYHVDEIFDTSEIKNMLLILINKDMIEYFKEKGQVNYYLSDIGEKRLKEISDEYKSTLMNFLKHMRKISKLSEKNLEQRILKKI